MAIIDSKLTFGENVEVTTDLELPEVIDLAAYEASGARDAIARGEPVWWVNMISDRGTGGTNIAFRLRNSSTLNGSKDTVIYGRIIPADDMFTGLHFVSCIPVTNIFTPRFLHSAVDVVGPSPAFSGMKVTAYLTASPPIFSNDNHIDWR